MNPNACSLVMTLWCALSMKFASTRTGMCVGTLQGCQITKLYPFLSMDYAQVEGLGAQSKARKGYNFAAQRSGAIVQKPKGPKHIRF